jgi:hypothetical protein
MESGGLMIDWDILDTWSLPRTIHRRSKSSYVSIYISQILYGQKEGELIIALIIHPKNETGRGDSVKWDEEYTLIVSDWYHRQHIDLLEEFMSWKNPTGAEPVPGTSPSFSLFITTTIERCQVRR